MIRRQEKILIVDDTPENIELLNDLLSTLEVQVLVADSGQRALDIAKREIPDLILLDIMMPNLDGFETCRELKKLPITTDIPVIFVTAKTDDVGTGFEVGGSDYIPKPFNAEEVIARVNHQLERKRLLDQLSNLNEMLEAKVRARTADLAQANLQLRHEVNERRFMQDRLNYLATHDFVTSLYNRSALESHITKKLARQQQTGMSAAFIIFDLDQFRVVNESCGHVAGDELLRQLADTVSGALESESVFARLNADRFAVIVDTSSMAVVNSVVRLLKDEIDSFYFLWNERKFSLSCCIGIVILDEKIVTSEQVMLMAEEALYDSKSKGRGSIAYYGEQSNSNYISYGMRNWALEILDALQNNLFVLHAQRLQALNSGSEKIYIEVLIRMQHQDSKNLKLIYPGEFIGPAERFGLISQIDRWVISTTIAFLKNHSEKWPEIDTIAINMSAVSIREAGMAEYIIGLLQTSGVPGELICLEITETEALINFSEARSFMEKLHRFGCRFSLDDFGSGYASYAYMQELVFNTVKVDGIFVRDMDVNLTNRAMVRSILQLSQMMGKPVIAEYVETQAVCDMLKKLGVDWGQGFLFHRPEEITNAIFCNNR